MLFRVLFNVLILLLILRIFRPFIRGAGRYLQRLFAGNNPAGGKRGEKKVDYSDLTPYEIEDADFEEVKGNREQ
ncbi:MAG: hypothetical protein JSW58_16730 [Candidatus Latescibacterota bacterium]|nr:MAG: hypothetical protein JSW58_16730 [Candidatus Latescibacterota bacterium]